MNCSRKNTGALSAVIGFLLASVLFLGGCVTPSVETVAEPTSPASPGATSGDGEGSSDLLRPGDALVIKFSGVSNPPPDQLDRITEDGFITLPLIGPVKAAGKTRAELQHSITNLYVPKYYLRLDVTVNPDARYVYVQGEVKRAGQQLWVGQMTVLKAIAAAGDFSDFAKKTRVQLNRASAKGRKPIIINCEKARKNSVLDLPVYPDDVIFVPRRLW